MSSPPTPRTVQRLADPNGRTLCFMANLGSRSRGWRTFRPHEVPEFEGDTATFEVTLAKGQWVFGRRLR